MSYWRKDWYDAHSGTIVPCLVIIEDAEEVYFLPEQRINQILVYRDKAEKYAKILERFEALFKTGAIGLNGAYLEMKHSTKTVDILAEIAEIIASDD